MNVLKFWNEVLDALGSTKRANNINEFRNAYVDALGNVATGAKTEIAALTSLDGTITGATANDTMTAVEDATQASTDTSAASLTSVNTAIASIENNFADLQTKVNAIIAALKA